jgi:hypothetical protein
MVLSAAKHWILLGAIAGGMLAAAVKPSSPVSLATDFSSFLARSDPVWSWNASSASTMPTEWVQSLFGGNGDLGFMLYAKSLTTLQLHVNRQTLWDDRTPDLGLPYYLGNFAYDQPRLPVGFFNITWQSNAAPSSVEGRVSLFDGVATLNVTTNSGTCLLSIWSSATHDSSTPGGGADVTVIESSWTGSEKCNIVFVPESAQSTWIGRDKRYVPNPPPISKTSVIAPELKLSLTSQPHLPVKGTFHTAAVLRQQMQDTSATYYFTVSKTLGNQNVSDAWATHEVVAAQQQMPSLRKAHEAAWHSWWPAGGFLTFEYSVLESFWYAQLYKFKSGARHNVVHDLEGPWFIEGTNWPDLHWDMNLQQTYYLPITANRPVRY